MIQFTICNEFEYVKSCIIMYIVFYFQHIFSTCVPIVYLIFLAKIEIR